MRLLLIALLIVGLSIPAAFAAPLRQIPPAPLNPGQSAEGGLDDIQQARQYLFDAPADQPITITMLTTSGDLNAFLSLATFDGDIIATDDDSGGSTDALIQTTLTEAGTYVITATRSRSAPGGSGTYSVTLNFGTVGSPVATEAPPQVLQVGARVQPIVRGSPVRGALTADARFVLYWFEGRTGQNVTVTPDTGTSLQPLLVLYNSNFNELVRSTPGTPLSTSLPTDGLYFVAVSLPNANSSGGNYAITMGDRNATTAPPRDVQPGETAITYGESVRGNISATVTSFTFQFNGTAGDTVDISMTRAGGDLDSYLYLLTTGGVIIAQDDNSGGEGGAASLSATLPGTGSYLILATRLNQDSGTTTGSFILSLQSDNQPIVVTTAPDAATSPSDLPPNLVGLPQLEIGQQVTGTITDEDYLDVYVFSADEDDSLIMRLESSDDALDPYLILLNGNQEVILDNDDIVDGEDKNSQIRYIMEATGYYVLVATRFEQENGASAGDYTLSLFREGEEPVAVTDDGDGESLFAQRLNAERLSSGSTPQGTFTPTQPIKAFAFSVAASDVLVDFSVTLDDGSGATVILLDDRLQPLASTDTGSLLGVPLPESGDYLVLVAPAIGSALTSNNGYILAFTATGDLVAAQPTLEATVDPESTEESAAIVLPITYGERVTGSIDNDNNLQAYQFSGQAGDIIRIRMNALSGSSLDPLVELRDATGDLIASNDDIEAGVQRNAFLETTLDATGDYLINATHFIPEDDAPASEGEYELMLETVDPNAVGVSPFVIAIEPGETVSGEINDEQTLVFYSFTANTGDVVTIEVDTLSGDLDAVMYLYGYTSGGAPIELRRNDDSPRGNTFDPLIEDVSLPRGGNYLIAIGRYPGREPVTSGEFALTLEITAPGQ